MHHSANSRRRLWRAAAGASVLLALATAILLTVLVLEIDAQASREEAQPADVIVILGAAAYRGRPSPVLKARLDHGLELFRRRIAPRIITTGGAGGDPHFTEGEVGRNYLVKHGVPSEAILLEAGGASTAQSTVAVAEIMRRMNLGSCVVVSDGYHIFRAKKLLEEHGLRVYGSPRPARPEKNLRYWVLCAREAAGYLLWRAGIRI